MSKIDKPYEGDNVPEDFSMPGSGIEETDRAVFNLFDKRLAFEVTVNEETAKVPVVFAAGERFALTRRRQPIRDKNNTLILPIISIKRTSISHDPGQEGYGTPIAFRDQPSYVVRKRLNSSDRDYQKLINKLKIKNQSNVASRGNFANQASDVLPGNVARPGKLASRRNENNISFTLDPNGVTLEDDLGKNIFEIITIPYPTFVTINYEVVFWTQYMQQMNQIIQSMMSRFDGQGHEFFLETREGYNVVAYIKSPFTAQDNFSDFTENERIVKYQFNMSVPTYIIAPQQDDLPTPFRRFLSAPTIEFGYKQSSAQVVKNVRSPGRLADQNKFILSDVEVLNSVGESDLVRGQGGERVVDVEVDPFTGKDKTRFLKVLTRNQRSGETVSSVRSIVDLDTQYE